MSQETAHPNPSQNEPIQTGGLSPDQQQTAIDLRQGIQQASDAYYQAHIDKSNDRIIAANDSLKRYDQQETARLVPRPFYRTPKEFSNDVLRTPKAIGSNVKASGVEVIKDIGNSMDVATKYRNVKRVGRAATEHFEKHEGAYQEQAVHEATEAGVVLKGWTQE